MPTGLQMTRGVVRACGLHPHGFVIDSLGRNASVLLEVKCPDDGSCFQVDAPRLHHMETLSDNVQDL